MSRRTVIPNGDDQAQSSDFNGQTFILKQGSTTTVDGAPVLTIDDDQVRFDNRGTAATTGETATVDVQGDNARIVNRQTGEITAENTGVEVSGSAFVGNSGRISGDVNGVNFANNGESSGRIFNTGTIDSDSRAVNIGGSSVTVDNFGAIRGTGDQRNGTIYANDTADNYAVNNRGRGVIDAGEGNNGAGISLQLGDEVSARIVNQGATVGRGQAAADSNQAGDGIRLGSGAEDGTSTFRGNIVNTGRVVSESEQGATSAIRVADGVGFDGRIVNTGLIDGANNGLYFGDGDHQAQVVNRGVIQSDSRALNIDGTGVVVDNLGTIRGTDDQRNGTVYADVTADDYAILNRGRGVIDAGQDNDGAGISLQLGDEVSANIANQATIVGRGQAAADSNQAGDAIRLASGAEDGTSAFQGNIVNAGRIVSESEQGATSAIRIADGVDFDGRVVNSGLIDGANNGVYFGNGNHDARVVNGGVIQSDSRAVNIDGTGVVVDNFGTIRGTDDQRNGTVYADSTADDFAINNRSRGVIDAGEGNDGAGVSLQIGEAEGGVRFDLNNDGAIIGRGDGDGNQAGDGVRVAGSGPGSSLDADGSLINDGRIVSEQNDGIRLTDVTVEAGFEIVNNGFVGSAEGAAIDASGVRENADGGGVRIVNNGRLDGDVELSEFDDVFETSGAVNGTVNGNGGNDRLISGSGDHVLTGGAGGDTFVFRPAGQSADQITDFEDGVDRLDVSAFGFDNAGQVLDRAVQDGDDTVITLADNSTVKLLGFQADNLDESDFVQTA